MHMFCSRIDEQKKLSKKWEAKTKVEQQKRKLSEKIEDAMKEHFAEQLKAVLVKPEVV